MLARPTTFILGAGASCDLEMPTGDGLRDRVAYLVERGPGGRLANERIWQALISVHGQSNWPRWAEEVQGAADRMARGVHAAASIDNLLHTHQADSELVLLGKLAISHAILGAEERSPIRKIEKIGLKNPHRDPQKAEPWHLPFVRMLTSGTRLEDPESLFQNAKFVVFNYDRCLELVLMQALQDYYALSEKAAKEIIAKVEIIHPYGFIGDLDSSFGAGVPFGAINADLVQVAARIKTFTESAEEEAMNRARAAVDSAEVLVFLGFGYLPQNMDLLDSGGEKNACCIHATTLGISDTDKLVVAERLRRFVRSADKLELGEIQYVAPGSKRSGFIDVANNSCLDLIANHRLRLTN